MSRIGERKLAIPAGVTVEVNGSTVTVKGSKGELSTTVSRLVEVKVEEISKVKLNDGNASFLSFYHDPLNFTNG